MAAQVRKADRATRFSFDTSLLAALCDRWRPETHTFHLTVGEMAPTLQDVSMLLGLPHAGMAVGPRDVPPDWEAILLARFGDVHRIDDAPPYEPFKDPHGPTKSWILQFSVSHHS